jgi:predicted short-subunit dehydrogenase-like oxidoreductase (DUF2520 family)
VTDFDRTTRIGILHAGRLGASLAVALGEAGYDVRLVHRTQRPHAVAIAERIEGATATDNAQTVVDGCDVVFVTCVDQRLFKVVKGLRFRAGQAVVHCSGATPVSVLDPALLQGASTGGIHPLQLFPDEHGNDRFQGVTFSLSAEDSDVYEWLTEVAQSLGGRAIPVSESERAIYHASATMVSPLLAGLIGIAVDLWVELGRSREEALDALGPLFGSTVDQVREKGVPEAITGPLSRGDVDTIGLHLDVTREASRDVSRAYAALALAQLSLVEEGRDLPGSDRVRLEELLRAAIES